MLTLDTLRRFSTVGLAVLLSIGVWAVTMSAQSVEREMVASVLDRDGQPVPGLTAADFLVREDGVAREVLRVRPATGGRQIALLVDTSEAAERIVGDLRSAVEAFVDAMSDDNEISIISFGGTPRILAASTTNTARLKEGIGNIFAFPATASYLLDAVRDTAQGFLRQEAPQPLIIAMTTLGVDYSNRRTDRVIDQLVEAGAAFYSVVFVARQPPVSGGFSNTDREIEERRMERDRFLAAGPTRTGGRRRELQASSAAVQVMSDLAADLRNQYVVIYSRPDTLVPPERVEIETTQSGNSWDTRGTLVMTSQ